MPRAMNTSTSPVESKQAVFTSAKATDLSSYVLQLLQNVEASVAAFDVDKLSDGQLQQRIEQAKKIVAAQKEEDRAQIDAAARREESKQEAADPSSNADIMDSNSATERRDDRSRSDRRNLQDERERHILQSSFRVAARTIKVEVQFYIVHNEDTAYITYITGSAKDRSLKQNINSARSIYRTLVSRGYKKADDGEDMLGGGVVYRNATCND